MPKKEKGKKGKGDGDKKDGAQEIEYPFLLLIKINL